MIWSQEKSISSSRCIFNTVGHHSIGPGNVHNPARRACGIGFLPCGYLSIPKGMFIQTSIINYKIWLLSLKLAERTNWQLHISDFLASYFMHVWPMFIHLLSQPWWFQSLFSVLMGISTMQSIQLNLILLTIRNKCGLLVLFRTGVQSMQSVIFTSIAHVLIYCYVDVMLGLAAWTTSPLIGKHMRRLSFSSNYSTLVLFGTSMVFGQMLLYVRHVTLSSSDGKITIFFSHLPMIAHVPIFIN